MNLDKFKNVTVAFYGCFDDDGNVSKERIQDLCKFYLDKGIKGFYLCGSSGEGFLMTTEERKQCVEHAMEVLKGKATVILHVGAVATKDSIELSRHGKEAGVDALSAVPNVYYGLSEKAIETHWTSIIEATDLPFIIYNIPQTTGYNMSIDLLQKMMSKEQVIGIKNSSENPQDIYKFKVSAGKEIILFNGPDEQYISGRIMGADAGIGGTYGVMPELYLKLENLFSSGKIEEARVLQYKINKIIFMLLDSPSLYGTAKAVLKLRGVNIGKTRLPILPTDENSETAKNIYSILMETINEYA